MKAYRVVRKIPEDRRVTLTLPSDFPVGEIEVIVLVQEQGAEQVSQRASLEAFFRKLDATPPSGRSKEEIDRYLEEERASWDR